MKLTCGAYDDDDDYVPSESEWIRSIERDGAETKYADRVPLGFLPTPGASVSIDEDAEDASQDASEGLVISGMSQETEKTLYEDLHRAYGKFSPERALAWAVVLSGGGGILLADGLHLISATILVFAGLWLLKDRV